MHSLLGGGRRPRLRIAGGCFSGVVLGLVLVRGGWERSYIVEESLLPYGEFLLRRAGALCGNVWLLLFGHVMVSIQRDQLESSCNYSQDAHSTGSEYPKRPFSGGSYVILLGVHSSTGMMLSGQVQSCKCCLLHGSCALVPEWKSWAQRECNGKRGGNFALLTRVETLHRLLILGSIECLCA